MPTEAIRQFVKFLEESERSPATIKNYRGDLGTFAAWFRDTNGDELAPKKITPTDLREFKGYLQETRSLRPASVNRKLATLKSFLGWAADAGLLEGGRAPAVPRGLEETRPGPRWLDRRERNALLRAVERGGNARDLTIVKALVNTGLRVEELCSLEWRDVTITNRKGKLVVRKGKGRKRREIPLNTDARKVLLAFGYARHAGSSTAIFNGQRGKLTARGVQGMLEKYVKAAELEDVSPHSLRHTFCKTLLDAGASLPEVAALAGHESLETTRRYCEPSVKDLERTVELIEEEDEK
ncbi:MAG: tyrosine-type recombinase/integrase [Planctomycetes bacterium]|nr:tyrosine-type recombinase/integrase [Planctomycetota bacterium]